MNTFANSLFSLLFGWARGLIQQLWTSASTGSFSAFFIWLGDHWVWIALVLCAAGTVMDFLIWLIRWRPYLAWRSAINRWKRRLHPENVRFSRGYQGGVALDMPDRAEAPPTQEQWEEPVIEEDAQIPALQPAPAAAPSMGPVGGRPMYAMDEMQYQDSARQQRRFTPAAGYEAPPLYSSGRQSAVYNTDLPAARRKRRSEKYERRSMNWTEKLIKGDADEDGLLDGLPPAVDRQQAFHEPVYPRQPVPQEKPFSAWQRPGGQNDRNGS